MLYIIASLILGLLIGYGIKKEKIINKTLYKNVTITSLEILEREDKILQEMILENQMMIDGKEKMTNYMYDSENDGMLRYGVISNNKKLVDEYKETKEELKQKLEYVRYLMSNVA